MDPATLDLGRPQDAHIADRLNRGLIIWLSTVRPDGRPHTVPVWFLWEGATILVFSQPDQKIRNLRANPRVMVALDDSNRGNDVVLLEGEAALLAAGTLQPTLPAYVEKYGTLIEAMGQTAEQMAQAYSQAIRITPTRFLFR